MRAIYGVDHKNIFTHVYGPGDVVTAKTLRFCSGHDAEMCIRTVKEKGKEVLVNVYSQDQRIKNILTNRQSQLETAFPEGDFLYDLDTGQEIYDFSNMKTVGSSWSLFPPVKLDKITLFCISAAGRLHKMYVGNGQASMAFCIYWINKKLMAPKEITNYGIKATFILLETLYNIPHYEIKDYGELRKALTPVKVEPDIPYNSKIYNHLRITEEREIKLYLPKNMKKEEPVSGEKILVTADDRVLLSQIIESGIVPYSEETVYVELDKNIEHIINISLLQGNMWIYVDKQIYEDQVLLDLGLEDRDDVTTVAKDLQPF